MTQAPATLPLITLSARRQHDQQRETLLCRARRHLWATRERDRDKAIRGQRGDATHAASDSSASGRGDEVDEPSLALGRGAGDIGAVMALRALLQELEFCLSGAGRLSELLRGEAVLYTANVLLGWLTPQKQRGPHYIKLTDQAVRTHLGRFDSVWGLRTGGTSLIALYDGWHEIQRNQQAYDKIKQADESYAKLLREQGR